MGNDMAPNEQLIFSTTPIFKNNEPISSGFFYTVDNILYLITAKHVMDYSEKGTEYEFEVHRDKKGKTRLVKVVKVNLLIHESQDLVALKFVAEEGDVFFEVDETFIKDDSEILKTRDAIEPVTLLGYPTGLWDDQNHLPLVRTGYMAIHPGMKFKGNPEGVINVANYEGDSGAPIFTLPQPFAYSKEQKCYRSGGAPILLLGIHHEGYDTHSSKGFNTPDPEVVPRESMPLAKYIKAQELKSIPTWKKMFCEDCGALRQ